MPRGDGATTPRDGGITPRGSAAAGKENVGNSRPGSAGGPPKLSSANRAEERKAKAALKQAPPAILEQQSAERLGDSTAEEAKRLSDAMDAEANEPMPSCPIALALRGEERNYARFEGVLEAKLSAKPHKTLSEMKEALETQKSVIKELRSVGKALLHNAKAAETVASDFTSQHEAAAAKVEGERDEARQELADTATSLAALKQEKTEVDARLNSALASFAAVDEQRRATLEERDAARAQAAVKGAAEEECRRELEQCRQDWNASKAEVEQLRAEQAEKQALMDKEMNDMREALGKEMVAAREAGSKLASATEEVGHTRLPLLTRSFSYTYLLTRSFSDTYARARAHTHTHTQVTSLRTKTAVMEESLRMSKQEAERLEGERASKAAEAQALERDKASLAVRVEEMQRRLDDKEAQHSEAFKSLAAGQEMQASRVKELLDEKESALAGAAQARAALEEVQAQLTAASAAEQALKADARVREAAMERADADLEAKTGEAAALRSEIAAKEEARQAAVAAVKVLEAECNVYREHAQQALPDKLRELLETKMQADKDSADQAASAHMQLAMAHAANLELEGKDALLAQLRAEVADLRAKLVRSETARRRLHNQNQDLRGNIRHCVPAPS